jgi:phospholipase C
VASSNGPAIEHIIVVMLENRSYDNVLGWLYHSGNQPPYNNAPWGQANLNGLTGNESNPGVPPVRVMNQTETTVPIYDPGELFSDMAQQILGAQTRPTSNPYDTDSWPPDSQSLMQGFTLNYAEKAPQTNVPDVMNYFTPAQVPVTAWLANNFAVCDQWFASVPTQTFTNRAFAHCAAPAVHNESFSLVDDSQYVTDSIIELPSVFSQLDAACAESASGSLPKWKVYFHDYSISTIVLPYVYAKATSTPNVNVATYDNSDWGTEAPKPCPLHPFTSLGNFSNVTTFMDDLNNNQLPMYSFIEPRYSRNYAAYPGLPNSNHPGKGNFLDFGMGDLPIDVADGEAFLLQLYNALCSSSSWASSLLIITYDEHGGLYDHVVPPSAVPPGPNIPPASNDLDPAADGFNFDVYGCRVPAVIVSPFIAGGTTITPPGAIPFDHASIIKTVWNCFNISGSLTRRDAAAPSLYPFLSATADNNPGPCPVALGSGPGQA